MIVGIHHSVRFNSDGILDDGTAFVDNAHPYDTTPGDSFGASGGITSVNFNTGTSGDDHAYAAALSPDGSIVLAGDETDSGVLHMAAVRLSAVFCPHPRDEPVWWRRASRGWLNDHVQLSSTEG